MKSSSLLCCSLLLLVLLSLALPTASLRTRRLSKQHLWHPLSPLSSSLLSPSPLSDVPAEATSRSVQPTAPRLSPSSEVADVQRLQFPREADSSSQPIAPTTPSSSSPSTNGPSGTQPRGRVWEDVLVSPRGRFLARIEALLESVPVPPHQAASAEHKPVSTLH